MSSVLCHRILEGLWAAGVRDMVVTPGSRSTPLLLAAFDSELRLHSILDERSAAFFALGRARARDDKVALLCTSGSAGAHYLPALLEARYAGHALVAITADRPPELRHTGANQTIDQRMLFAAACPPCLEIPVSDGSDSESAAEARRVHEAVANSRGPIHVNLAFRKPLEPAPGTPTPRPIEFSTPSTLAPPVPDSALKEIADTIEGARRGLIVCGPSFQLGMGPALIQLASQLGFALLAESTSGARFTGTRQSERISAFGHILEQDAWAQRLAPEVILQFGADPVCGPLLRSLESWNGRRIRFGEDKVVSDPTGAIELVGGCSLTICKWLATRIQTAAPADYVQAWRDADEQCSAEVQNALALDAEPLGEAAALATVLGELPADTQLTLGNSLPIRGVDAVMPGHAATLRVLHQRGTSGIDGLIAGAFGSSFQQPSVLLIGDVSCCHDLSSLALHHNADGPVLIVVLDNGGGKIFSHLPVAKLGLPPDRWAFWETPPAVDLAMVCQGFGVAYRQCDSVASLADSFRWALKQETTTLLQVKVGANSMQGFLEALRDSAA